MKSALLRPVFLRLAVLVILATPLLGGCSSSPKPEAMDFTRAGDQMRDKGDDALAIDFYKRALRLDPDNGAALASLAALQEKTGDRDGAISTYRAAVAAKPEDAALWRALGRLLVTQEKPIEAKEAFEKALKLDPKNPKILSELGVALDCMSEHKAAQEKYQAAFEMDPNNLAPLNNLAYSHILSGEYDAAIDLLKPHFGDPRMTLAMRQNLGLAYGLSGDDADAARILKIDLPPAKVKETLAYYKRRRAEQEVTTSPYMELGSYATEALARSAAEKLRDRIEASKGDLKPVIAPEVSAPGGTPRFSLRLMSCAKPEELRAFCDALVKDGIPCKPYAGE